MMLQKKHAQHYHRIIAIACVAILVLVGCGGGGNGDGGGEPPPPPPPQLVAVVVSPSNAVLPLGTTQQFVATGTYSDTSSQDVTGLASWSSSNVAVAHVSNDQASKGLASSVAVGTTTITATVNGIDGEGQLTVDPASLTTIEILPLTNVHIAIAATQQFTATGHFTDSSNQNITDLVIWSSSDASIAVISNAPGEKGLARGIAAGAVTIGATFNSINGAATLTVLPIKALDYEIPNTKAAGLGGVGIDRNGNALAVWNYQFTGGNFGTPAELYYASYMPISGWTPEALIDMASVNDFPATPTLAMNANGDALLAWMGHNGIYASKYTPGSGMQPAKIIASGTTPFLTFANSLRIAIDASGNGLLVWANDNGDKLLSSQYDQTTDIWTVPQELPNVNRGFAQSTISLAMNANGYGVVLWEYWNSSVSPEWTLYASLFVPGIGQGTGWQVPQSLYQSDSWQRPTAAINDAGEIVAVWVDHVSNFPNTSLYAKRYIPNQGWQPLEGIAVNDINRPTDPAVAMNNSGNAVVVWRNGYDKAIRASRYIAYTGWQAPEMLWPTGVGDPTVLRPHITTDGRILATWVVEDLFAPFKVGSSRFVPGSSWENPQGLPYIEHKGKFSGINITFNPSGAGVAFWAESYDVFDGQFFNTFYDFYANTQLSY